MKSQHIPQRTDLVFVPPSLSIDLSESATGLSSFLQSQLTTSSLTFLPWLALITVGFFYAFIESLISRRITYFTVIQSAMPVNPSIDPPWMR